MADILGEDHDRMLALASRVSSEVFELALRYPTIIPSFVRNLGGDLHEAGRLEQDTLLELHVSITRPNRGPVLVHSCMEDDPGSVKEETFLPDPEQASGDESSSKDKIIFRKHLYCIGCTSDTEEGDGMIND